MTDLVNLHDMCLFGHFYEVFSFFDQKYEEGSSGRKPQHQFFILIKGEMYMYQALYRKYRPSSMKELVGQEHITKTLINAISEQKMSHAYLFTGPRGTGKTSTAKIIARAFNCESPINGEPCGTCESCVLGDKHPDIFEIDAASNNGVEEIREIRDKVRYTPTHSRYKIYIIDEVHMLTEAASNAFLKTLEEPPAHVIFILATTEPHKILPTIRSRCQRHDFKRIPNNILVSRMEEIAKLEKVEAERNALEMIARLSQGGMRDSLSLLDQSIAYAEGKVTLETVTEITGGVTYDILHRLVRAIYKKNIGGILDIVNLVVESGKDPLMLVDDLTLFYRDVLLVQNLGEQVDLARAILDEDFRRLTLEITVSESILDELTSCKVAVKNSTHPKATVEVSLVRLCSNNTINLEREIENLKEQVKMLLQGAPVAATFETETKPTEMQKEMVDSASMNETVKEEEGMFSDFLGDIEQDLSQVPNNEQEKTTVELVERKEVPCIDVSDKLDFVEQVEQDIANDESYIEWSDSEAPPEETTDGAIFEQPYPNGEEISDLQAPPEPVDLEQVVNEIDPNRVEAIREVLRTAVKEIKIDLTEKRDDIDSALKKLKMSTFTLFKEANIALASAETVVITLPTAAKVKMASRAMNRSFIQSAIEDVSGRDLDMLAVQEQEWTIVRDEFIRELRAKQQV